jgi:4-aminobutyrate aminotransferase-like enzyme
VVPPPDFLKAVKEVAKENNAVLICDEMICGFGRTGKMFGVEHFGVTPDIMTVGKGIANGFPVAGVISNDEIINSKPFANPSGSSSSYGGNPLAGCACDATLEAIIKYNLVENSRKVGEYLLNEFKKLQEKYRFIGDVRGKGLMIGVEMVSDRKTKKPLDKNITRRLFDECIKRGMISMCYSATIRVNPPLIITEKEAETAIRIYDEAFEAISKEFNI